MVAAELAGRNSCELNSRNIQIPREPGKRNLVVIVVYQESCALLHLLLCVIISAPGFPKKMVTVPDTYNLLDFYVPGLRGV